MTGTVTETELLEALAKDGRFAIERMLGRGAAGWVFEAVDRHREARVALKVLHVRDPAEVLGLKQEFRLLRDLEHPNLVAFDELVLLGGRYGITMSLVEGVDWSTWVSADPHARFGPSLQGLSRGLAHLHANGLVHGDVKPRNVLVQADGRVRLLDFGLSMAPDATEDERMELVSTGTVAFMAPEQLLGDERGPPADVYAAGVMSWEALVGRHPFPDGPDGFRRRLEEPVPPLPPAVGGPDVSGLLRRMTDPNPRNRPSAPELAAGSGLGSRKGIADASRLPGREAERAALRSHWRGRSGRAVLLLGPSGIGKTALIDAALRDLPPDRTVLRSACHPREAVPFNALDGLVDALVRGWPPSLHTRGVEDLAEKASPMFPVLGKLSGGSASPARPALARERRRAATRALAGLFRLRSAHAPLTLVLDDVHWSDRDAADLTRALLAELEDAPVDWLFAARDDETDLGEMVAAVREQLGPSLLQIELGPLSADARRAVWSSLVGDAGGEVDLDDDFAGLPFLLVQGAAAAREGVRGIPLRNVDDLLGARLAALDDSDQRLVRLASLLQDEHPSSYLLAAAGLGDAERHRLYRLERSAWLRARRSGEQVLHRAFHDGLRGAVVEAMTDDERTHAFDALTNALDRWPEASAASRYHLAVGRGDEEAAVGHALDAARRAAENLAFDLAADWWGRRIERLAEPTASDLVAHAEALATAGRGEESARSFLEAASLDVAGVERSEFTARAADQLIRVGAIERGLALHEQVMQEAGTPLPRGVSHAVRQGLWRRARFLLGTWRRRPPTERLSAEDGRRLDRLWRGSVTFAGCLPSYADAMGLRYLREALARGDAWHQARALGLEAANESAVGGAWLTERAERMLSEVDRLLATDEDPYREGYRRLCHGVVAWGRGDWAATAERCADAVALVRARCPGADWEVHQMRSFELTARWWLGDLETLAEAVPQALEDARERGDAYAVATYSVGDAALWALAEDRAADVLAGADEVAWQWARHPSHLARYFAFLSRTAACLYQGELASAVATLDQEWPMLHSANLTALGTVGAGLWFLRGRVALARVAAGEASARKDVLAAGRALRRRPHVGPADAMAHQLAASLAALDGRGAVAETRAAQASEAYGRFGMATFKWAMDVARGRADLDAPPTRLARPDRFVALLTPGLRSDALPRPTSG